MEGRCGDGKHESRATNVRPRDCRSIAPAICCGRSRGHALSACGIANHRDRLGVGEFLIGLHEFVVGRGASWAGLPIRSFAVRCLLSSSLCSPLRFSQDRAWVRPICGDWARFQRAHRRVRYITAPDRSMGGETLWVVGL